MTENKEWYENWKSSADKWIKAIEAVKQKRAFEDNSGYSNLQIAARCGYCFEYRRCRSCPLFKTWGQGKRKRICKNIGFPFWSLDSHFHCFVRKMYRPKSTPDFGKALEHAKTILRAILADCPDRARAEKDEIEFTVGGIYVPIKDTR